MIRDITIGQYYPSNSVLHKLDSRVKLIATIVFIISLFVVNSFIGYAFAFLCLAVLIYISKVPLKFMLKGLKSIMFIIIFTVILNVFVTDGETVLFNYGIITITLEGIILAIKMCVRLIMLIVGSSLLTLTTTPIELTNAIERGLMPLKKIGVPAHEIAMMMTIALRFIPTLLDETDKIIKAQQARGADFETGNIINRAKSLIPILVPLFVSSFRRAEELAMAMESRCYSGSENRTKLNVMKYKKVDLKASLFIMLYILGITLIKICFF